MLYRISLEVSKENVLDLLDELYADKRVLNVGFQKEKRAYKRASKSNGNGHAEAEAEDLIVGTTAEVDAVVLKALRTNGGRATHSYVVRQLQAKGIAGDSLASALQQTDRYHLRGKTLRLGVTP